MHARYLATALMLAATAFLPFGALAHAEGNQPTDDVVITEVVTDVDTGITEMQPVAETSTESVGDVTTMVAWQNSSTVRRIQDGLGRLFADNISQTSLSANVGAVTVSGFIWREFSGQPSFSCGATLFGSRIVSCETQDVSIPAHVRGTGGHSYQSTNGNVTMPMTDTGWRFVN